MTPEEPVGGTPGDVLFAARARVLHDLEATRAADPASVSALEEAVATRRWWVSQWEQGKTYVAGLVAQDVQDALLEQSGRWPLCTTCEGPPERGLPLQDPHALYIHPELGGPDPRWVCEKSGTAVAELGALEQRVLPEE